MRVGAYRRSERFGMPDIPALLSFLARDDARFFGQHDNLLCVQALGHNCRSINGKGSSHHQHACMMDQAGG